MLSQTLALCTLALAGAETPKGVMHVPFKGNRVPANRSLRSLTKRASNSGVDELDLTNSFLLYEVEMEIGSNKQKVGLQIDTGSSDLWVMSTSNKLCQHYTDDSSDIDNTPGDITCYSGSQFDPSKSSTYKQNSTKLEDEYVDTDVTIGNYAQDTITFGDITLEQANFAVATETNSTIGIFGVGPVLQEGTAVNYGTVYQNIPVQLYTKNLVSAYGYSLWLNDLYANEGSLLFGGVDHAKYSGSLYTVPMIFDREQFTLAPVFEVMLSGIEIYQGSNSQKVVDIQYPFALDSGTTITYLPTSAVNAIVESLGGSEDEGGYYIPCGVEGGLSYDFSGAKIQVPFSELTIPLDDGSCYLLISADDENQILGDSLLRSAYVVYDMFNNEISLANTNYNATSSSIETFDANGVPSATQAPSYSSTVSRNSIRTTVITDLSLPGDDDNAATGLATSGHTESAFGYGEPARTASEDIATQSTFAQNTRSVASVASSEFGAIGGNGFNSAAASATGGSNAGSGSNSNSGSDSGSGSGSNSNSNSGSSLKKNSAASANGRSVLVSTIAAVFGLMAATIVV